MSAPIPLPPLDYLLVCFDYAHDTGALTWRRRPLDHFKTERTWKMWNTRFAGKEAGHVVRQCHTSYRQLVLDRVPYQAHLICYYLGKGVEPGPEVDHGDGNGLHNWLSNLTSTDNAGNTKNKARYRSNTSGVVGVHWAKRDNKWRARSRVNGRDIHLGYFDSIEDAAAVRAAAETKYGFHKNHGREL